MFGINQSKGKERDHIPASKFGFSRLHMAEPVDAGAKVGQSNVTSGAGVIVTSGGMYFAEVLTGCVSGGIAQVTCFGTPQFLAK